MDGARAFVVGGSDNGVKCESVDAVALGQLAKYRLYLRREWLAREALRSRRCLSTLDW